MGAADLTDPMDAWGAVMHGQAENAGAGASSSRVIQHASEPGGITRDGMPFHA